MISVLIERSIALDMESTYAETAKRTLHLAFQAPGFVSGEAFSDTDNPRHRFVLSRWQSAQHWSAWFHSEARKEMMSELNLLLEDQEKVYLLENH